MNTINQARKIMNSNSITKIEVALSEWTDGDFLGEETEMFMYSDTSFTIQFTDGSLLVSDEKGIKIA